MLNIEYNNTVSHVHFDGAVKGGRRCYNTAPENLLIIDYYSDALSIITRKLSVADTGLRLHSAIVECETVQKSLYVMKGPSFCLENTSTYSAEGPLFHGGHSALTM